MEIKMKETWVKLHKRLTRRKWIAAGIIIFLLIGIGGIHSFFSRKHQGVPVETAAVEKMPLGQSVFATGRVELTHKQEIIAYSNAMVKELLVKPGDVVKKGQVMGWLEATEAENQLLEAEATLTVEQANFDKAMNALPQNLAADQAAFRKSEVAYENSRKNLERKENLFHEGAISLEELEKAGETFAVAEADYFQVKATLDRTLNGASGAEYKALQAQVNRARTQVATAQQNLDKYRFVAEQDGTVLAVEVEKGDYVTAGTKIMTLGDPSCLEVKVGVGEADAAQIEPGQKAKLVAAALAEKEFNATVTEAALITVTKNDNNNTKIEVPVKLSVDGERSGLRPGYTVDVKIITIPEKKTRVVPYEAVVEKKGAKYVFVVEKNRVKLCKVKTGLVGELLIEVLNGVKQGDQVIVNPAENIKEGMTVNGTNQ